MRIMDTVVVQRGEAKIALMHGRDKVVKSQINEFIEKYGQGIQHVAIEVDDIEAVCREWEAHGVKFSGPLKEGRDGFGPLKQRFTYPLFPGGGMMGLRPVVEMQFADFISCAFDQIIEVAAKNHYRWNAPVPMVIRAPFGGGVHGGPFHSECPEGWFFHSPGLKLVAPSTPYDAKGLLKAAIRDPNPVIYFEHKFLYRRIKAVLPTEDYIVPIGKAEVKRTGGTISVITYGAMVHLALEAATVLEKENIQLEVVDLRTLIPLDKETIYESVRKTSKAIMLHEDNKTGGIGAEIAALLAEDCFDCLDGPVLRVAAPDTPVPFSTPMEEFFLPKASDVVAAARMLAAY